MINAQDLPVVIEQVLHRSSCDYSHLQLLFQEGGRGRGGGREGKDSKKGHGGGAGAWAVSGSALRSGGGGWDGGGGWEGEGRGLQGFGFATSWLCDLRQAI